MGASLDMESMIMNAVQSQRQWADETNVFKWLAIVCAVVFLVGVAALPAVYRRDQSTRWPTTTGTIDLNGLKTTFKKPHLPTRYKAIVGYHYTVDGIPRAGTRISFADSIPTFEKEAGLAWLDQNYPAGKTVTVYYSPTDPDFAVLEPGASELMSIIRWWLVTMACCVRLSAVMHRRARRRQWGTPLVVAPQCQPLSFQSR